MSVLQRLACAQGVRDEKPNVELAKELAETKNADDIALIAKSLSSRDKSVSHDCVKVLYEIGYLDPQLIRPFAADFVGLLNTKDNRMAWGAMIALATVAAHEAELILRNLAHILKAMQSGSVITVDNGVKVLASAASAGAAYSDAIFVHLIEHLKTCRPKEVAQHAESTFAAVTPRNREAFLSVLAAREEELTDAQKTRVNRLIKKTSAL